MASSKRSLSDFKNKDEFPFLIKNGIIEFPKLFSKINNSDKLRYWFIFAVLLNKNEKLKIKESFIDINKFKDFEETNNYKKLNMHIYTEYGQIDGKITETTPTIIDTGKNLNKKNETSIISQSIIYMRNLYLKKIKSGYSLNLDDLQEDKKDSNDIFPMAVHEYNKYKKYIIYPCYSQYKLDGIRIIAKYDKETDIVTLLSRRLNNIFGFENIKSELKKIFKYNPNIIFDGEFYNHNLNLQEISGIVRHQDIELKEKKELFFYIFDFIDTSHDYIFEERINILINLFSKYNNLTFIKLLDTVELNNENDGDLYFQKALAEKYEGIIYKNKNAKYEYSSIKEIRSKFYIKRKNHHSLEYKIIGYEQGKGKDLGAIVFTLETPEGYTFNAVPNMQLKTRKEMFKLAEQDFEHLYKFKDAQIDFDEYSSQNVPLRAKFIAIRDYE